MPSPMGGPNRNSVSGEKPKSFKQSGKQLISYCKPYIPAIVVALLLAIGGAIFTIIGPGYIGQVANLIQAGITSSINLSAVVKICTFLVIIYSLSALFSYTQGFIMATVTQRFSNRLRTEISQKINRLPLNFFDGSSFGDILSRVTNDVDTIGQTLNQSLGGLVSAVTLLFGTLLMMLITNWIMALTAVFATLIGFFLMMQITKRSQKYFKNQQKELGEINGHIEEVYSSLNIVKVYNGTQQSTKKFNDINGRLHNSNQKAQFFSGMMMPLMSFIGNFGYVAVCIVGAILVMQGHIEFGVVVSFMIYVRLFTQPLSQIGQAATNLQSTAAASERVFEFLGQQELSNESEKTKRLSNVAGDVEFQNVHFGYEPDRIIINDFSAHAKAGQKIAIVGPTGAGKTTLVNLLMRFYELNSGKILIDGIATQDVTRENVHEQFCMVLQDTWIFHGTVRENVVYSKEGVSDEEVIKACRAVGIHHFITTLPQGYDTILDDKANLSQGQRQLITIARAMVQNAPMLILDEATSSVDTRTEVLIQKAMDMLMEGRTSFVIAHRLSTIRNSDIILVMKDGDIIESGNHETLMAQNGFYADLYNSQFEQAS